MINSRFLASLSLISTLALGACAGGTSAPAGSLIPSSTLRAPVTQSVVHASSLPNISGWYAGRMIESIHKHTFSGGMTMRIKQSGSTFVGILNPYFQHHTLTFRCSGSVYATAKGAWLKFTIHLPNGPGIAGSGTVTGKNFDGKASIPDTSITFTTVKS